MQKKTNKYPATPRIIFDRKKQSNQKQKIPGTVEIELLYNRERKRYSTKVRILPSEWDDEKKKVKVRDDANTLNMKIKAMFDLFDNYIQKLIADQKEFSWSELDNFLKPGKVKESFLEYIKRTRESKTDLKGSTLKNHKKLEGSLKEFKKIRFFEDLTLPNILAYDKWLHEKGYKQTTVASYHKFLKIYIHDALREERIEKDPYIAFKVDRGKPALRKYLTEDELDKIINADLTGPAFEKVRDLFLFQCYTGLAYADLSKFDFKKVIERDGKFIIHDVRQKTGEEFYIVLLSNAVNILKKYDYVLPLMTNQQYNMRLKIVAGAAELPRNLTSHMGRHTYASLVLNKGIPIEVLKEMMGHTDIKTTQIYARMINKTVESAYDLLEERLNPKGSNNTSPNEKGSNGEQADKNEEI